MAPTSRPGDLVEDFPGIIAQLRQRRHVDPEKPAGEESPLNEWPEYPSFSEDEWPAQQLAYMIF